MGKLTISLLVPCALFLMWSALLTKCDSGCICKQSEIQALLEFKHSLTDRSNYLTSWVGRNCCDWNGLGCEANNRTCNIVTVDLHAAKLEASHLSSALIQLHHLRYLDLSGNSFLGSQIPKFIGSITSLEYLNLSSADFAGQTPHHLGNLTSLQFLALGSQEESQLELDSWNWVSGLKNLQYLDLSQMNASQATGSLTRVIQKLTHLRTLRLEGCQLTNNHFLEMLDNSTSSLLLTRDLEDNSLQNPIPHIIMNITHISFLDLSHNSLNLSIPSWLNSKTSRLEHLDLSHNRIEHIEGGIFKLIQGLCGLKYLDLSFNVIREDLTNSTHVHFNERCNYSLEKLDISFNLFRGQLPDCFMKFTALKELDIHFNSISGVIPTSVSNLSSLSWLDLSNNNFSGIIPTFLGGFSSLEFLDLSNNYFHGMINQDHFTNLSRLYSLGLGSNSLVLKLGDNWLPPFQLQRLLLSFCEINAPFPKWILKQSNIFELDLSHTGVSGSLPDDIDNKWPELYSLVLSGNHIDGQIPRSLCSLSLLNVLDLRSNRLSATIPDCLGNLPLAKIKLSSNKLSGLIPASLVSFTSLQYLSLNNNTLEGELPSMSNITLHLLQILDFGENRLSGKIPPWSRASLPHLIVLRLRTNHLSGEIPESLCSLDNLQIIDLADNGLTGAVPRCIGNLSAMVASPNDDVSYKPYPIAYYYTDLDDVSAVEVVKGKNLEYTKILRLVVVTDLSNNNLTGQIPIELTKLVSLLGLNLSHNHLTGSIPMKIGKMKSLESLDLSNNHLSGSIPLSLSELTSLGYLNLSYNRLQGPIPTGNQIQTLNDLSIYQGNPDLCGDVLPKKCTIDSHPKDSNGAVVPETDDEEDEGHQRLWLYIPSVLGCVTGFWGIIGVLIVKREWRYAYFQLADDVGNWIYVHVALSITRLRRKAT